MTEEERKKAVEQAKKYVEKNPDKDPKLYDPTGKGHSGTKGAPGEAADCSGLVSNSIKAAGIKDPNHGPGPNGVKNIVENTRSVETSNAQSGNIVTFKVGADANAHVGMITKVDPDNGNITMIQSGKSTGPTTVTFDPNAKNTYWGEKFEGVRAWDTPDPVTQKSNNSTQTTTSTTNSTRTEMPSRSTNSTFLWFLKGFSR